MTLAVRYEILGSDVYTAKRFPFPLLRGCPRLGVEPNRMFRYSIVPRGFGSRSWHLCFEISNTNHAARLSPISARSCSRAIWVQVTKHVTF